MDILLVKPPQLPQNVENQTSGMQLGIGSQWDFRAGYSGTSAVGSATPEECANQRVPNDEVFSLGGGGWQQRDSYKF